MRIVNKTEYDTDILRKLLTVCLQEVRGREGQRRELSSPRVTIVYKRGGQHWVGGYAYYNSDIVCLKLPRHWIKILGPFHRDFAWKIADTFIHELGHCIGIHHHRIVGQRGLDTIEYGYQQWLKENINETLYPIAVAKKTPKTVDRQAVRYAQSLKNKIAAATRLKRAQTLFRKWQTKVRYYERLPRFARQQKDT